MSDIGPHYQTSQSNPKHISVHKKPLPMGFALNLHKIFSYSPDRCDMAALLTMSSSPSTVRWNNHSRYVRCKRQDILHNFGLFHWSMLISTLLMPSTYQIVATQSLGLRPATKKIQREFLPITFNLFIPRLIRNYLMHWALSVSGNVILRTFVNYRTRPLVNDLRWKVHFANKHSENDSKQIYYLFFIKDKINNSVTSIKAAEETCNTSSHKRAVALF